MFGLVLLYTESAFADPATPVISGSTCYCCARDCAPITIYNYDCSSLGRTAQGSYITGYMDGEFYGKYLCDGDWTECSSCGYTYVPSSSVSNGFCYLSGTGDQCSGCSYGTCGAAITHCGQGFYKSGSSCIACPDKALGATTSGYTNTGITACYMPANITLSDSTGSYVFTSNCNYTN